MCHCHTTSRYYYISIIILSSLFLNTIAVAVPMSMALLNRPMDFASFIKVIDRKGIFSWKSREEMN